LRVSGNHVAYSEPSNDTRSSKGRRVCNQVARCLADSNACASDLCGAYKQIAYSLADSNACAVNLRSVHDKRTASLTNSGRRAVNLRGVNSQRSHRLTNSNASSRNGGSSGDHVACSEPRDDASSCNLSRGCSGVAYRVDAR
jgi:hypothetical protein